MFTLGTLSNSLLLLNVSYSSERKGFLCHYKPILDLSVSTFHAHSIHNDLRQLEKGVYNSTTFW